MPFAINVMAIEKHGSSQFVDRLMLMLNASTRALKKKRTLLSFLTTGPPNLCSFPAVSHSARCGGLLADSILLRFQKSNKEAK